MSVVVYDNGGCSSVIVLGLEMLLLVMREKLVFVVGMATTVYKFRSRYNWWYL